MSFQSGGAILGPPGAPGAPVSIIIVMPGMMILYELQNLGEPNNK